MSGRPLLADAKTEEEIAASVFAYPPGSWSGHCPVGQSWALQNPRDYLDVLSRIVNDAFARAGVSARSPARGELRHARASIIPVPGRRSRSLS
ncbi:hypothetical protein [Caproicibacter fermentans]|uniref:hypothetical protein n=1 Tax=Caproicibacter fermentans TaxID=2576756 RepID=UPI0012EEC998|nr:hypothetical protein [Caproicibacter fermentans]